MLPETPVTPGSSEEAKKQNVNQQSWDYIKRIICENFQGVKPSDIPDMTMNDVMILTMPRKDLLGARIKSMSADEARASGYNVPKDKSGKSLIQRVREQQKTKKRLDDEKNRIEGDCEYELKKWVKKHGSEEGFEKSKALKRREKTYRVNLAKMESEWIKGI